MSSGYFPNERRAMLLVGLGAAAVGVAAVWRWPDGKPYPHGEPMAVELSTLPVGKLLTLHWQERPVWVLRRSASDIATLAQQETGLTDARSQQSVQPSGCRNQYRSLTPEIFVAIGLCTHQGCTPALKPGVGFVCPCHASRYDLAGRVFHAGPAPANLVIPAHHFASQTQLVIGTDA